MYIKTRVFDAGKIILQMFSVDIMIQGHKTIFGHLIVPEYIPAVILQSVGQCAEMEASARSISLYKKFHIQ